ncbi:MAG: hypothetical protein Q4D94_13085 [Bacillota bacterium]|nr:hypothetical protein [Bacillota bacterium]
MIYSYALNPFMENHITNECEACDWCRKCIISGMETTQEALKREFEEELYAKIEVDRLIAVGEIFLYFQ